MDVLFAGGDVGGTEEFVGDEEGFDGKFRVCGGYVLVAVVCPF